MQAKVISITAEAGLIFAAAMLHARAGGGTVSGKVGYEGTPAKPKFRNSESSSSSSSVHGMGWPQREISCTKFISPIANLRNLRFQIRNLGLTRCKPSSDVRRRTAR